MLPLEELRRVQEKALGMGAGPSPGNTPTVEAATLMRMEVGRAMPCACAAPPHRLSVAGPTAL